MATAYLGLGSNQGDRLQHLQRGVERLQRYEQLRVAAASPVYETEAHTMAPDEQQPAFYNAVIGVETGRTPDALLRAAQAVEAAEGRVRDGDPWQPRPLDVDLLVVGEKTRTTDRLTLPHPRLAERRFVLRPWADLAPNLRVPPPFDATVRTLLDACRDGAALRRTGERLRVPDAPAS